MTEAKLKERIATELTAVRDRSLALTIEALDDGELTAQHSPLMSPLVWDLAHVGNYEEQWLVRAAAGAEPIREDIDHLYDAFEHPRAERVSLPLLPPAEAHRYIADVRSRVLDSLDQVRLSPGEPLIADGYVYGMVIQHEHQHDETMLATHQLRRGGPALEEGVTPSTTVEPAGPPEVLIAAGSFEMGTSDDPWAYDNERPAHRIYLDDYWIDTAPVTNAEYLAFMDDGGYDQRRWWTGDGWEWRCRSGRRSPAFWLREGATWVRRRFGRIEVVPPGEPVQHVCWYEADAYARWAGKRLPTEAEWEKAARFDPRTGRSYAFPWGDDTDPGMANIGQRRLGPAPVGSYPRGTSPHGCRQMIGDVWEWTSSDFLGYDGFCTFPYAEYSEVFFGSDYKVLRGGSWATHPTVARATFRNWDYPIRRQIFAGFRCARSGQ